MNPQALIPVEQIERAILLVRGQKVILDVDLAALYGVDPGTLNRAVKRNRDRFPLDFMFQLTPAEAQNLRCQFGISSPGHGGRRYLPFVFTEQGVAMLSGVLRSKQAVRVNVAIMRAFVRLRDTLTLVDVIDDILRRLCLHRTEVLGVLSITHKFCCPRESPDGCR